MRGAKLGVTAKRTPRVRRERDIQAAILAFLRTVPGVVAWKAGAGAFRQPYHDASGQFRVRFVRIGKRGTADIIGFQSMCMAPWCEKSVRGCRKPGHLLARFLAIEVKRPGEKPTPEQAAFLEQVQAAGGIAVVAYSVTDVAQALTGRRPTEGGEG